MSRWSRIRITCRFITRQGVFGDFAYGGVYHLSLVHLSAAAAGEPLPCVTEVELACGVLDSFPRQQRATVPHTTRVEWFCFPQGLFLEAAAHCPAPGLSSFVRFIADLGLLPPAL